MIGDEPLVEPVSAAKLRVGPRCSRFGFAIQEPRGNDEKSKRRAELVLHVAGWIHGVDVVDEWSDDSSRWVVLSTAAPIAVESARSFAEDFPRYVRDSFRVDRSG